MSLRTKIKDGIIMGVGIAMGMMLFDISLRLLSLGIAILLGLLSQTGM